MINGGVLVLNLINFGFIALLPRKFFKQGAKLTAHFWMTAAPLFACPALLMASFYGILPPLWNTTENPWAEFISFFGIAANCCSVLFLGMSIGIHRVPIHMFHDKADQKVSHLVTYGPYRHIRHPIYSSYLLALFAAMVFCPQAGTILCFLFGATVLNKTAAAEEQRLAASPEFGAEYTQYIKESGRFLPPLSAIDLNFDKKEAARQALKNNSDVEAIEENSISS